ncbi:MAG: acetyl-CoA decarbonylase/synthase complex subunit delta [Actinobacteria bacterium]|nr:MAG: acetyl-CoA decarbonylase/synthase complex subunit delta [Actinomycetota bacterium]
MGFSPQAEKYSGEIREVVIGAGDAAVTVGGSKVLPFHGFEGEAGQRPIVAMEVLDVTPEEWPEALTSALGDVMGDPVAWAKKCETEFGAEAVCLSLLGTDPNAENRSAEEASQTAKAVSEAIGVPLVVYGSGNVEKDAEVLPAVAEALSGANLVLGPVQEENYKTIAASAMGYKDVVAGETPIDVNMAKQLNILMTNLGMPEDKILVDPSTGALGYGLDYTYSVMERDRLSALLQGDKVLQMPLINNMAKEVWKSKEAKVSAEEEPAWGDEAERGVLWEVLTGVSLLMAGADILIVRHPRSAETLRKTIEALAG